MEHDFVWTFQRLRSRRPAGGAPLSMTLWPPANMNHWPETRVGALLFNLIVLVLVILIFAVPPLRRGVRSVAPRMCHASMCCLIISSVAIGALGGIWLHFVPCLWWTCDWGPNDGEAVRGSIMFVSGAVIAMCACACLGKRASATAKPELVEAQGVATVG